MLVFILMAEARKPDNWRWLWAAEQVQAAEEKNAIDTRLPDPGPPLPAGTFVSRPVSDPLEISNLVDEKGIDPRLYQDIKDDTPLRTAEHHAWLETWKVVQADGLRDLSADEATYVQLFRQTHVYRGRKVCVKGSIVGAFSVPAIENDLGIDRYWLCWLQPLNRPDGFLFIYTTELPKGFPHGENIKESVQLDGVCFKRTAYDAKGGIMTAPIVMTNRVEWFPETAPAPPKVPSTSIALAALLGSALVAGGVVWFVLSSSRQKSPIQQSVESLASAEFEQTTVEDSLRRLSVDE